MFRYVDVICPHVWPEMFDDEPRDLRIPARLVDRIRELCAGRPGGEVCIFADLSCHEWRKRGREGLYPAPAPEEMAFQIWVALIHGADGICLFPCSFDPFVYAQIPAKIEEMLPECTALVDRMAPMLCADESPREIRVTGGDPDGIVDVTTRRHEGADYVFVLNGTAEPQTVTLTVDGLGDELALHDAVAGKAVGAADGSYSEDLKGLQLRIWKLVPRASR